MGDKKLIRTNRSAKRLAASDTKAFQYPEIGTSVSLEFSGAAELFQLPVVTVSRSEEGFQQNLQGVSVVALSGPLLGRESHIGVRLSCGC